jgi:hypothetical protein
MAQPTESQGPLPTVQVTILCGGEVTAAQRQAWGRLWEILLGAPLRQDEARSRPPADGPATAAMESHRGPVGDG